MTEEKADLSKFQIKIEVPPDIEILITTRDPCDCVEIAGGLRTFLRLIDLEPTMKILP